MYECEREMERGQCGIKLETVKCVLSGAPLGLNKDVRARKLRRGGKKKCCCYVIVPSGRCFGWILCLS